MYPAQFVIRMAVTAVEIHTFGFHYCLAHVFLAFLIFAMLLSKNFNIQKLPIQLDSQLFSLKMHIYSLILVYLAK